MTLKKISWYMNGLKKTKKIWKNLSAHIWGDSYDTNGKSAHIWVTIGAGTSFAMYKNIW